MIIVVSNNGQLCNKIWSYVSIIAYAIQYNQKIIIADFVEYVLLFPHLKRHKDIKIISNNRNRKWLNLIIRFLKKMKLLNVFDYKKSIEGFSIVNGWDYRFDTKYFTQDRIKYVKYLFTPTCEVVNKCKNLIKREGNDAAIIVGVHIRRGDYQQAMPDYYYSDEIYLKYMLEVKEILKEKGKIKFLICSNEKINLKTFNQVDVFQNQMDATAIDDLYALSLCDYVIGPPSTFSMWASFYGNKPLLILDNKREVSLNNFEVICKTN